MAKMLIDRKVTHRVVLYFDTMDSLEMIEELVTRFANMIDRFQKCHLHGFDVVSAGQELPIKNGLTHENIYEFRRT